MLKLESKLKISHKRCCGQSFVQTLKQDHSNGSRFNQITNGLLYPKTYVASTRGGYYAVRYIKPFQAGILRSSLTSL